MLIRTGKNYIDSFLVILFCTFVILGTTGYSYAQQELQTQQPSTVTELPWSNNLPTFDTGNTQHRNTAIISSQTFTNSKNLDLNHSFVSNKVIGPDRFRFITSYWTTSDTSRAIDAGTSANETRFNLLGPDSATTWPSIMANPKVEVDAGEGFSTLAVVLQYQGVVHLAGITAVLKLPSDFKAQLPLIDDLNNYNIALSSYRGHIYP